MAFVTIDNVSIGYRGPLLLNSVSCTIEPGQRIGLLGRNGSGKTTFMRMILGEVEPDHGEISTAANIRVAMLQQDVPNDLSGAVREVVSSVFADQSHSESRWEDENAVDQILSRMSLEPAARFENLSSGMKRRVLLAKTLVTKPDLLLLDEPTNHLDIEAIEWMETFLSRWQGTLLFVTHDRAFLRRLATRILEIDSGELFDWSCDYETFLRRKEAALAAQEKQDALFAKKLAAEEAWIRQGIKARRTRNEGRVKALKRMRQERTRRRQASGELKLQIQEAERSGQFVAKADGIRFGYQDRPIIDRFSTTIMRGDKVGIIGPNGVGKTTLIRLLLGELKPHEGTVRTGTNLKIAYFDQLRQTLDGESTVQDNVADGYDTVTVNGVRKHVIGYLQDFLFTPERARTPIRFLSGGERNRLLLAKLFAKPANVIVLDEPTNDLDAETLELLEDRLVGFDGTILLVSHDREFLNNVVTSTIVFEADGVKEYDGGYDDWLRQRANGGSTFTAKPTAPMKSTKRESPQNAGERAQRRLSYKESKELESLPQHLEELESKIAELHQQMADPAFYKKAGDVIANAQAELAELEQRRAAAYARWEELETIAGQ